MSSNCPNTGGAGASGAMMGVTAGGAFPELEDQGDINPGGGVGAAAVIVMLISASCGSIISGRYEGTSRGSDSGSSRAFSVSSDGRGLVAAGGVAASCGNPRFGLGVGAVAFAEASSEVCPTGGGGGGQVNFR